MSLLIANEYAPSSSLPRKRERERASFFLHLSRLRGKSTRKARRAGAATFRDERAFTEC